MDENNINLLINGLFAIATAIIAILGKMHINKINFKLENIKLNYEKEEVINKYRGQIVQAAADLQSRIYNILELDFMHAFYINGNDRTKSYFIENTLFLFAQFFFWNASVRDEIHSFSHKDDQKTRDISKKLKEISKIISTDSLNPSFRFFDGEQRAIGEHMIATENNQIKCLNYTTFTKKNCLTEYKEFQELKKDITELSTNLDLPSVRLLKLQNLLVELIDMLDPTCKILPSSERKKCHQHKY